MNVLPQWVPNFAEHVAVPKVLTEALKLNLFHYNIRIYLGEILIFLEAILILSLKMNPPRRVLDLQTRAVEFSIITVQFIVEKY